MENRSIAKDIRNTGFALRDWLGPYYMLGGAVAFGITMLTLLDPSGWLVRGVGAALLTVTLLVWARHFHLRRRQPAPPPVQPAMQGTDENGPVSPHGVLLAITLFFLCGIVVSEAFRAHQRSASTRAAAVVDRPAALPAPAALAAPARTTGVAAPADADEAGAIQALPLPDATARTAALAQPKVAQPAAEAAQAGPPSASAAAMVRAASRAEPGPAPGATPAPTQAAVAVGAPLAQASVASPRRQAAQPPRADAAPAASSAPASDPALAAQQRARCSELLSRFSLGEALQPSDRHYLGTTCH